MNAVKGFSRNVQYHHSCLVMRLQNGMTWRHEWKNQGHVISVWSCLWCQLRVRGFNQEKCISEGSINPTKRHKLLLYMGSNIADQSISHCHFWKNTVFIVVLLFWIYSEWLYNLNPKSYQHYFCLQHLPCCPGTTDPHMWPRHLLLRVQFRGRLLWDPDLSAGLG